MWVWFSVYSLISVVGRCSNWGLCQLPSSSFQGHSLRCVDHHVCPEVTIAFMVLSDTVFFMSSCMFSMSQKKNVTLVPQSNKAAIFAFWIQLSLQLPYSLCRSCKKIRLVVFIILHISNCSNIIANLTALGNSYLNGTGEGVIWSSIILLCEIHKMSDSSGNTKNICVWTKIMAGTMSVWGVQNVGAYAFPWSVS